MAKVGELDFGSFELDGNLDFGDLGDFEDSKPKSNKREVVLDVGKSIGEGVKSTLTDPAKIRNAIKSSLPGGFKSTWDMFDEATGTVSSMYDETVKELKPGLSTITKKLDNFVPEESARLKKVTKKLHDFFKVEEDNYGASNQNIEDQGVENMLKGVFATQIEQQEAIRAKEEKETLLRDRLDENRHRGQLEIFSRMDNNLQRIGEYTVTPNMAFQKKSLELAFRSYFTLGEILRHSKESSAKDHEILKSILKNTGLPEFVKIKESERFKQIAKDRLWGGVYNRMFGEGSRIRSGLDKLKEKGKEFIDGAKQGIEGGLMLTDSMEQIHEMNQLTEELTGKKVSKWASLGKLGGGFLGEHVLGKVSGVAKDRINENENAKTLDQKLARWVENPDEVINNYLNSDSVKNADLEDGLMPKIHQAAAAFLELFSDDKKSVQGETGHGMGDLISPSYTDERLRRAQVDVVPGYLARILREVTVLRTNDDSQSLTVYDFNTGKFKTQSKLTEDIKDSLRKRFKESSLDAAKTVVTDQFVDEDVSDEDKNELANAITALTAERGIAFDRESLSETKTYAKLSERQKELLSTHVFSKMEQEGYEGEKNKTLFTKGVGLIRKSLPDVEKEIRERIEAGQRDELEAAGIITVKDDGRSWELNEEKYYELARQGTVKTSDVNKKTNISKLSPKEMLEKIKKIGIFNWNYKPGEGPQNHDYQGPMAQDVNKELGDEAAPGGKSIDLISMNGANMSAIQGLSEEVEKLKGNRVGKDKSDTNYLKEISKNTFRLVKLFEGNLKKGGFKTVGGVNVAPSLKGPSSGVQGVDDVTSFLQTGVALLSKGLTTGVKGLWGGGAKVTKSVGDTLSKNKENIKDAGKYVTDSILTLVGKGLNLGREVLFTHLPNGAAKIKNLYGMLKTKFKELVNGAQDLYQEGMTSPVILATLMRAGYYKDQATGKVITTMDDLRNLKGHVVNHLGEVIIRAEDVARGLYNSKGEKIRSTMMSLGSAAVGAALWAGKKLYTSGKALLEKGADAFKKIPGIGDLKAAASNAMTRFGDKVKGFDIGFGTQRIYDVLLQIRDLVSIGKPKKLVSSILSRKSGVSTDTPEKGGKSWFDTLFKSGDSGGESGTAAQTATEVVSEDGTTTTPGSPSAPSTTQSSGVGALFQRGAKGVKAFLDKRKEKQEHDENFVGPQMPKDASPTGGSIMDRIKGAGKKLKDKIRPPRASDAPDFVGPSKPSLLKKGAGFLKKGASLGKGLLKGVGGLASGALGLLGGNGGSEESTTPTQDTAPKNIGDRFKSMVSEGSQKVREMITRKGAKFNDKDGDGSRDGNAVEQLKKQEEDKALRLERNRASAEEAAERANEGIKYKSSENVIDTIAKKAGALFDMLKGGAGGIFETAASFLSMDNLKGLWNTIKNPKALLGTVGKGIAGIGRMVLGGGKGAVGLLSKVGTVARAGSAMAGVAKVAGIAKTALTVGGLGLGGVGGTVLSAGSLALSALGAALSSPVVLGGLAIAGTAAAGYYGYKYFTRDNLNVWETLRAMQYGLPGNKDDKKYNHMVMNLERYFLEGRIGYSDGKAYILDKKVDHKEICKIMDVDPGDSEHVQKFAGWLSKRFKPFFLNSVSALFSVDKKAGLAEIEKLSAENKEKALPLLQFLEGPYAETEHPFKDLEEPLTDINVIKAQVALIEKELGKQKIKGNKPNAEVQKKLDDLQKEKSEEKALQNKELKTTLENEAKKSPLFKKETGPTDTAREYLDGKGSTPPLGVSQAPATFADTMNAKGLAKSEQGTESVGNSLSNSPPPSTSFDPSSVKKVPFTESLQKIKEIIAEAGKKVGVDPRIMQIMAAIESGFKPAAKAATSSATGLFQFIKSTWQSMLRKSGSKHGLTPDTSPLDPMANSLMGAEFLKENSNIIRKVKPDPNVTDLYIAHFLGPGGAQKFLKSPPDAVGENLFPQPAKANPTIFRGDKGRGQPLTIGQIYQNFENKLKRLAASFGIEFPTTGKSMVTGEAPTPAPEGPKPPTPLEKIGTAPTPPSNVTDTTKTPAAGSGDVKPSTGGEPSSTPSPASTPSHVEPKKDVETTTPAKVIPGVDKPAPVETVASQDPPKPTKKYPWMLDERPDDLAVGRSPKSGKSGEALYGSMDGVISTMESQLTVNKEVRDVLKDRVAPTLEKMLEVLSKAASSSQTTPNAPQPPQKSPPSKVVPNTPSALDLRRMA